VIAGFAAEEDMAALISGAVCLCYPSLSEGFGLPVLDGFACGTPVITSTTTSLPEVAGDAALLVDPCDTRAISDALHLLISSPEERARLAGLGNSRVRAFTWQGCAARAAAALERAATVQT
jgi:glycosyltransferase involved in cell wall biosynthesis